MLSGFFSKIKEASKALNPYALKGSIPDAYYHHFKIFSKCLLNINMVEMGSLKKIVELLSNNSEDPKLQVKYVLVAFTKLISKIQTLEQTQKKTDFVD